MAFWRMHNWQYQGIMEAGTMLMHGPDSESGEMVTLSTMCDCAIWQCQKCKMEIIMMDGDCESRPDLLSCDGKNAYKVNGVTQ